MTTNAQITRNPSQNVCKEQICSIDTEKQQTKALKGAKEIPRKKQVHQFFRQSSTKYMETQQNHWSHPCFRLSEAAPLPNHVKNDIQKKPASFHIFRRICYVLLTYIDLLDSRNNKQ